MVGEENVAHIAQNFARLFVSITLSAFKVSVLFCFWGSFLADVTHLEALFVFHAIFDII